MKKTLITLLAIVSFSFALDGSYLIGMRSSKYGFIGYESSNNWGFAVENSLFVQDMDLQYARLAAFYRFSLHSRVNGHYAIFAGSRYNQDYYDFGSMLSLDLTIIKRYFDVQGTISPIYDSDAKLDYVYSVSAQTMLLQEVGLFGGFKNIPDYRNPEKRIFGGLVFDTRHLILKPEISTPFKADARSNTRVSVNFIYKAPF